MLYCMMRSGQTKGDNVTPIPLLGFCLMPNRVPLALWPRQDGALSQYMGWLLTATACVVPTGITTPAALSGRAVFRPFPSRRTNPC